jgi:hypothetical protein
MARIMIAVLGTSSEDLRVGLYSHRPALLLGYGLFPSLGDVGDFLSSWNLFASAARPLVVSLLALQPSGISVSDQIPI